MFCRLIRVKRGWIKGEVYAGRIYLLYPNGRKYQVMPDVLTIKDVETYLRDNRLFYRGTPQ